MKQRHRKHRRPVRSQRLIFFTSLGAQVVTLFENGAVAASTPHVFPIYRCAIPYDAKTWEPVDRSAEPA